MRTLIIDQRFYEKSLDERMKKHPKIRLLHSSFVGLEENQPIVYSVTDEAFYGGVKEELLEEVLYGHSDELKIQTSRVFNVEMKKYISNLKYRDIVKKFLSMIDDESNIELDIKQLFSNFVVEDMTKKEVEDVLKIALIKTVLGPDLTVLMEAYGIKEVVKRYQEFLKQYKFRF